MSQDKKKKPDYILIVLHILYAVVGIANYSINYHLLTSTMQCAKQKNKNISIFFSLKVHKLEGTNK